MLNQYQKIQGEIVPKKHPMFAGLLWVSAAVCHDSSRAVICHVLVEQATKPRSGEMEWKMVATDGRRIHVATFDAGLFTDDLDMLTPGLWEVVHRSSKLIVVSESGEHTSDQFPDWRKVVPRRRTGHTDEVTARTTGLICMRSEQLFATDFLIDACGFGSGFKADKGVEVRYGADPLGHGALIINHELGVAAVMPMRMGDGETTVVDGEDTEAALTPDLPHMPKRTALPTKTHKGDEEPENLTLEQQ